MSGFLNDALLVVPMLAAVRPLLFLLALVAHHRWRLPVTTIERLIRVCFPQRKRDQ